MFKKVALLVLCCMLLISGLVHAQEDEHPARLEKPASLSVRPGEVNELLLRLTQPASIMKQMEAQEYWIFYELDWKINDGPWKFNKRWDRSGDLDLFGYYESTYDKIDVCGLLNNVGHDERNAFDIPVLPFSIEAEAFDLQNNNYSFRYRYVYEYEDADGYSHIVSPYSDVASIGKGSTGQIPNSLEAPRNLSGELKRYEDGQPYFHFTCDIPKSVEVANKLTDVWTLLDWKVGSGSWASESGQLLFEKAGNMLADDVDVDPIDEGGWDEVNIEKNTYYFRMFFELAKPDGTKVRSPFSNVFELGTPAFYRGASSWATAELDKGVQYGLVTDRIKDNMSGPITREEFAELATRLYEVYTGKKAEAAPASTFTDTANPEILKANKLGIVNGVGNNKFDPKALTNREQIAAMLNRAVGVIKPTADMSIEGAPVFADEGEIAPYFVDNVKFMAKNGFITGVGGNRFDPKAKCTREQAVLIAVRVYEAYK